VNNIEWGCGTDGSSGSAREIAAKKALVALRVILGSEVELYLQMHP
jgi:hypothetical protein